MVSKAGVFHERKDCVIRVRVSKRVKEQFEELAKRKGRTVSELLRRMIYEKLRKERKENVLRSEQ